MSKFYFRQSEEDPNSYSVFVAGRLNSFGEPYCVLPLVTYDEAFYYCQGMNDKTRRHTRPAVPSIFRPMPTICE